MKIDVLVDVKTTLGEGPLWDVEQQRLYWIDAPGMRVGGKTGSANKLVNGRYDPTHAVGSFAAVFPVDGPLTARRYAILIVMDEPGKYPRTGGYVAAPAVGRIADRIAGFLGVERRADHWRTALGEKIPEYQDVEGDGL